VFNTLGKDEELSKCRRGKILWLSSIFLDLRLDASARLEIMQHMVKKGHKITFVALHSKKPFAVKPSDLHVISIPLRSVALVSTVLYAVFLFFCFPIYLVFSKPDFLIVESEVPVFGLVSSIPFSKLRKTKVLLDIRSTPVETGGFQGLLQVLSYTASVLVAKKLFNGITFLTPQMGKEICEKFNIRSKAVASWPSGVSTSLFDPENRSLSNIELRKKLGLDGKFVVFYHGSISANRGIMEAVEAMSIVRKSHPDIVLYILGSGSVVLDLKRFIEQKNLQGSVVLSDPVNYFDVPKFIGVSDVCIIPLPNHPFWRFQNPLKLLEYLAMGKVVIVTDIPAHRSVIGNDLCGIYISSIRPSEIAESIIYAYNNKSVLEKWGAQARRLVEEQYTWDKVAEKLETFLCKV
jgi:glycosyltransferase involved in cell wall biosynthesis